jgi:hypothetical protein
MIRSTCVACQLPPLGVVTPCSFKAWAIPEADVIPWAWMLAMTGSTEVASWAAFADRC